MRETPVPTLFVSVLVALCVLVGIGSPAQPAYGAVARPQVAEAQAWCVTDATGAVLASSNADERFAPASITKVMTAMVALDSGMALDTEVTMPELPTEGWEAAQVAGFETGSTASLEDMLEVLLVYSANDAAYAIAQAVGGSQQGFADLMNQKAQEIGMDHTTFKNPHGLEEDDHMSTAGDLVKMGRYALTHYPFIARMVRTRAVTIPVNGVQQTFHSTDELMDVYAPLIGIKTGKVEAGTTFLGASRKTQAQLYTCVLGCSSDWGRFQDTMDLMEWAYGTYRPVELSNTKEPVARRPFAYRFGWHVPVTADAAAQGLVWPDSAPCTYTSIMASRNQLLKPGEAAGACIWQQGGHVVGAMAYHGGPAAPDEPWDAARVLDPTAVLDKE